MLKNQNALKIKLIEAIENNNNISEIKALLQSGINPNTIEADSNQSNILHYMARDNNYDVFKLLLEFGADINHENDYLATPLHWAVHFQRVEIVELIINHPNFDVKTVAQKGMGGAYRMSCLPLNTDNVQIKTILSERLKHEENKTGNNITICPAKAEVKDYQKASTAMDQQINQASTSNSYTITPSNSPTM